MFGLHHQINGHEFEHVLCDGEGQGCLERCLWDLKELDVSKLKSKSN